MDGRPSPVTKAPLNAPQAKPTARPMQINIGVWKPNWAARPINVDDIAIVEATERSISPAIIRSAIGNASNAFSVKLKVMSDSVHTSRKCGDAKLLNIKTPMATTRSNISHDNNNVVSGLSNRSGMWRVCVLMN